VSVEALRSGSAQHSLIRLNAQLTSYVGLNFLAVHESFHLAWPIKVDSSAQQQLDGAVSTVWHLWRTNFLSL
jgi:hypothetical protein